MSYVLDDVDEFKVSTYVFVLRSVSDVLGQYKSNNIVCQTDIIRSLDSFVSQRYITSYSVVPESISNAQCLIICIKFTQVCEYDELIYYFDSKDLYVKRIRPFAD